MLCGVSTTRETRRRGARRSVVQSQEPAMSLTGSAWLAGASPLIVAQALPAAYWLAPIGAVASLAMALFFYRSIMEASEGDESMVRIARAVRDGAYAYLRRQYKIVAAVFAVLV